MIKYDLDNSKIAVLSLQNSKTLSHKHSKNKSDIFSEEDSDLVISSLKSKGLNPFINLKKFSTQRNKKINFCRPKSSYVSKPKMRNILEESPEIKQKKIYITKKYINYNIIKNPDDIYKIFEPLITPYRSIVKSYFNGILNDKKKVNNSQIYRNRSLDNILLKTKQIQPCPLKNSYINNINNSCIAFRDMFIEQNKKEISKNEKVYYLKKRKRNNFRKYNTKQKKDNNMDKIYGRNENNSIKKIKLNFFEKDNSDNKNIINKKINGVEIKLKRRSMGTNVNFDEITKKKFVYHNNVKMKTFLDLSQYKKKM